MLVLTASLACTRPAPTLSDAGPAEADAHRQAAAAPAEAPGSLVGRVVWRGPAPRIPPLDTSGAATSVCGPSVVDNSLRIDVTGGIADVVVWVDAPAEGTGGPDVLLDQRGCLFWPPILAARAGATLRLDNSDALTHTVHALKQGETLFNLAMPLSHMPLSRPLPSQPGVVEVRCDVHPWMHATVRTFPHSHFTTTAGDGRYRLSRLKPEAVVLHAWHPRLGEASRGVTVGTSVTPADVEMGGGP
jgi:plastocyanin